MPTRSPSTLPPPASSHGPEVRARHPQTLLKLTRGVAPAVYPSIAAALSERTRDVLDTAIPMAWIPKAIDVEVMEAVALKLGPATTAQLVEARQREEMGSALFDGFVKMALRIFGATPFVMVKRIPSGWPQLFRGAGTAEVVSTVGREATVRFRGLPPVCLESAAWMAALPVGLRMLYELVNVKGTVDCKIEDAASGTVLLTFRWH